MRSRTICLNFNLAPGDVTVLTSVARDLKTLHPEHRILVETPWPELWTYNPHVTVTAAAPQGLRNVEQITVDYQLGSAGDDGQKHRTVHFLQWLHEDVAAKTGLDLPTILPRGDFHFSPDEADPVVHGRYWVLAAGGKTDMPTKVWDPSRFQQVADQLRAAGFGVVQVGNAGKRGNVTTFNPPLHGVTDMVGRTSLRQLLRLIRDADGVVCGNSFPMHAAAALERPCVVLAGGREAWWWAAYVNENRGFGPLASGKVKVPHRFLHTHGLLQCVEHCGGCWKRYTAPEAAHYRCLKVVEGETGPAPECLALITAEHVIEACMSYYQDQTLPPISRPRPFSEVMASLDSPVLATARASLAATDAKDPDFDSLAVGGRFTVFTLMYGDYHEMHRKSIESFLATATPGRYELRVISNELCPASVEMVDGLVAAGKVSRHYRHLENRKKYPVMREAFHDPEMPITTPYVVWFDDDTLFDKDPEWMRLLAKTITREHPNGCRLYGPHYSYTLAPKQAEWVKEATWYRGRPLLDASENEVPNGDKAHFASGGFWAMASHVIREQDVPDARLGHNGGDVMCGVHAQQGGWKLCDFSSRKSVVNWSAFQRRGLSEKHPGQD